MRTAFSLFDLDHDGLISVDDLLTSLTELGIKHLDKKTVYKMVQDNVPGSTGFLDYDNFRTIVKGYL